MSSNQLSHGDTAVISNNYEIGEEDMSIFENPHYEVVDSVIGLKGPPAPKGARVGAHVMFFARTKTIFWETYKNRALINMQMRFDGQIGFPGGFIDEGEDLITGLNREVEEEIGTGIPKVVAEDWICSHYSPLINIVLHFYCKEVTEERFLKIEENSRIAREYGIEVLGNLRVPLYTMSNKNGGLPQFLKNNLCGNTKQQLLMSLHKKEILSIEEIRKAVAESEI